MQLHAYYMNDVYCMAESILILLQFYQNRSAKRSTFGIMFSGCDHYHDVHDACLHDFPAGNHPRLDRNGNHGQYLFR